MTIVARTLISVPERSASDTWERVVELIAPDTESPARCELSAIAGVACSCIADEALADDPLVVHGVGPRLRIYALYGDDAVDQERANESALGWIPTAGDWRMSIPCLPDDLAWVRAKLARVSARVTAREVGSAVDDEDQREGEVPASRADGPTGIDMHAFFRR